MEKRTRSPSPTKLRYVPEAGYRRGNETRTRLITAAIKIFSQHGFDGASTRDIARAASLNTPALQYYFDNKEGLYDACAEHVVAEAWDAMKEVVTSVERLLASAAGDDALIDSFCALQVRLAEFLNGASGDWLLWLVREQSSQGADGGFLVRNRTSRRMMRAGRAVVARLLGRSIRDPESLLHEFALMGQLTRFYMLRDRMLGIVGWREIDAAGLELIKRVVTQNSVAALRAIVAQREEERRAARRRPVARRRPSP